STVHGDDDRPNQRDERQHDDDRRGASLVLDEPSSPDPETTTAPHPHRNTPTMSLVLGRGGTRGKRSPLNVWFQVTVTNCPIVWLVQQVAPHATPPTDQLGGMFVSSETYGPAWRLIAHST